MAGPLDALQAAGYSSEEIAAWSQQRRNALAAGGFKDNEIDAYFTGGVVAPDKIPQALENRIEAGNQARKREGGLLQTIPQGINLLSTPDGRAKLWDTVQKYPMEFLKSMKETAEIPGEVAKGNLDLTTDEGIDKAIGLGALVAFGRLGKTTQTAKTSGLSVAQGETLARIERTPTGAEIHDVPVGGLPNSADFATAAKAATGGDAPLPVQEKLLKTYEEQGRLPAEVAHDAQSDPVVAQRLLSKDPKDMPYGGEPPAPPEPPAPKVPEPPSYSDAQKTILDKISVGEGEAQRPWSWSRLYTDAVDELHPLKAASENAYELARLTRGQFGKSDYFLNHATFDFNTFADVGKPLKDILAPVKNDFDGLRAYAASARALELEAKGIKSGFDTGPTVTAPPLISSGLEAARTVVAEGRKQFEQPFRELVDYQNQLTAYLRDSGVLSKEGHAAMLEANKNFVPFYRVMDESPLKGKGAGSSMGPGDPIKRIKGSSRDILDPLESVIKNTYAYISIAERNAAGIELIDALKQQGFKAETKAPVKADPELTGYLKEQGVSDPGALAEFVQRGVAEDGDVIRAYRNGVREEVAVNDPDLVAAFRGIDRQSVGMLTRIFALPAKGLRAGTTIIPDFIARNLIRDFMTAFVNSKGLFSPIDTLSGLKSVLREDAAWGDWVKGGGANSTMVALDRSYLQESLTKLSGETGLMERGWNVVNSPWRGLRMVSELIENATRVGEFKKAVQGPSKAEIQSAAFAAREVTLDFARMGAKMRAYNMVTAFANAQIQGVDRIVRGFIDRPVNTALKVAGGITVPSILLWWANHDDPRYQELPHWQKDLFWIVPTDKWEPIDAHDAGTKPGYLIREKGGKLEFNNGSIWRIPKPFELGVVFGSGVERVLDHTIGSSKEAYDDLSKSIVQAFTPSYIPTAIQPMIEQFANRSTFTDRTLIPADMEKHLPEYQYTPYTTQLSRKLGQMISAFPGIRDAAVTPGVVVGPGARALTSPILIENYIRSWTGGMGMYMVQAADLALRKAGQLPDPVTPTPTLADIPFVKAFAVRYPSAGTQSIQDFYDDHEKQKRFFDTWMARAKEGDTDAMRRIQDAGGPQMFMRLDAIKQTLTEHSHLVRDIYKYPDMPGDEKRQLIDSLYFNMVQIGRAGRQMQRSTAEAAAN